MFATALTHQPAVEARTRVTPCGRTYEFRSEHTMDEPTSTTAVVLSVQAVVVLGYLDLVAVLAESLHTYAELATNPTVRGFVGETVAACGTEGIGDRKAELLRRAAAGMSAGDLRWLRFREQRIREVFGLDGEPLATHLVDPVAFDGSPTGRVLVVAGASCRTSRSRCASGWRWTSSASPSATFRHPPDVPGPTASRPKQVRRAGSPTH